MRLAVPMEPGHCSVCVLCLMSTLFPGSVARYTTANVCAACVILLAVYHLLKEFIWFCCNHKTYLFQIQNYLELILYGTAILFVSFVFINRCGAQRGGSGRSESPVSSCRGWIWSSCRITFLWSQSTSSCSGTTSLLWWSLSFSLCFWFQRFLCCSSWCFTIRLLRLRYAVYYTKFICVRPTCSGTSSACAVECMHACDMFVSHLIKDWCFVCFLY